MSENCKLSNFIYFFISGSSYCNTYQNMIPKDKSKNFHEELGELNQRGRAFSLNTKN